MRREAKDMDGARDVYRGQKPERSSILYELLWSRLLKGRANLWSKRNRPRHEGHAQHRGVMMRDSARFDCKRCENDDHGLL